MRSISLASASTMPSSALNGTDSFVAAARENRRTGIAVPQLGEERWNQRRLAEPGLATNQDDARTFGGELS